MSTNASTGHFLAEQYCLERNYLAPFLFDLMCTTWTGKLANLILMLYMFVGLTKISELLMESAEYITSRRREASAHQDMKTFGGDSLADLTIRSIASNCPELVYSIAEFFFFKFKFNTIIGPNLIIV